MVGGMSSTFEVINVNGRSQRDELSDRAWVEVLAQGRAHVLLHGRRLPTVGRVTIDMTMINIGPNGCSFARRGEVATIMGSDQRNRIEL